MASSLRTCWTRLGSISSRSIQSTFKQQQQQQQRRSVQRCLFSTSKMGLESNNKVPSPASAKTDSAGLASSSSSSPKGSPQLSDIDASKLIVEKTSNPKYIPATETLTFGTTFSDHMLTIKWNNQKGWQEPRISPYKPLELDPSCTIFHYAPSLFEGMKAYKDHEGKIRIFRPDMNMKRMNTSADRVALPTFKGEELIKLLKKLIAVDSHWIPSGPGNALYIRPTLIGTQAALGVGAPSDALLFVITSPVGAYYKTGFKPVSLDANPALVRAWPGGTGSYKLGANYASAVKPQMEAATKGYQQNLWLFGPDHLLTEVGTMNLFVVFKKKDGSLELVTPPLDGTILPGVTRDSILGLAREHASGKSSLPLPKLTVSEREVSMKEIVKAEEDGTLGEMFGSGTAAVVSPVERVGYMGREVNIPTGAAGLGPVAEAMLQRITDIQLGRAEHEWSVVIDEAA